VRHGWTHVRTRPSWGLDEQYIFHPELTSLCSLRRVSDSEWRATLLNRDGVSSVSVTMVASIREAQIACEGALRNAGWRWLQCSHEDAFAKTDRARMRREERRFTREQKESVVRQPASNESDIRPSREREDQ